MIGSDTNGSALTKQQSGSEYNTLSTLSNTYTHTNSHLGPINNNSCTRTNSSANYYRNNMHQDIGHNNNLDSHHNNNNNNNHNHHHHHHHRTHSMRSRSAKKSYNRSIANSSHSRTTSDIILRQKPAYIITQLLKRRKRQDNGYKLFQQQRQLIQNQQRQKSSFQNNIIENKVEKSSIESQGEEHDDVYNDTKQNEYVSTVPVISTDQAATQFELCHLPENNAHYDYDLEKKAARVSKYETGVQRLIPDAFNTQNKITNMEADLKNNIDNKTNLNKIGITQLDKYSTCGNDNNDNNLDYTSSNGNVFTNYDEILPYLHLSTTVSHGSSVSSKDRQRGSFDNKDKGFGVDRKYLSNEYPGGHRFSQDQDSYLDPKIFDKEPQNQSLKMSFLVGIFVAVGGFLYGYDTGLINSITDMPYVTKNFTTTASHEFTNGQHAIIVSSLSIGTFFGALLAPLLCDRYGRRPTVMVATFGVFMVGNTLQICSKGIPLFCCGRVVCGLGVGLISAVVPLYQAETVHKSVRGAIICCYQWAITWGLLVSSAVSQGTRLIKGSASLRIPLGLQFVWATLIGIGMYFLPESPRYYVLKDQLNDAAASLSYLRGVPIDDTGLLEELVEVKANYDYEMSFHSKSILDCFKSSPTRYKQTSRIFTGIAIQAFQQFSGINFIFYYGVNFFARTGIQNSYMISFITYAVNVAFNIPGLFLVDLIGRRKLLIGGAILMFLGNIIVAIIGTVVGDTVRSAKIRIPFICLFIASFSATWGGGVWVVSAEMFPLGVRSKCASISAASNWLANVICAAITPYIVSGEISDSTPYAHSTGSKIFFIWAALNLCGAVIVFFSVYETSGLTLEEIDEVYKQSPCAYKSAKVNKEIKLDDSHLIGFLSLAKNYNNNNQHHNSSSAKKKKNKKKKNVRGKFFGKNSPDDNATLNSGTTHVDNSNVNSDKTNSGNTLNDSQGYRRLGPVDFEKDCKKSDTFLSKSKSNSSSLGSNSKPIGVSLEDITADKNSMAKFKTDPLTVERHDNKTQESEFQSSPQIGSKHFVDLGHGLGLNTHNRGPPSIVSEDSDFGNTFELQPNLISNLVDPQSLVVSGDDATKRDPPPEKGIDSAKRVLESSKSFIHNDVDLDDASIADSGVQADGSAYNNNIKEYMAQLVDPLNNVHSCDIQEKQVDNLEQLECFRNSPLNYTEMFARVRQEPPSVFLSTHDDSDGVEGLVNDFDFSEDDDDDDDDDDAEPPLRSQIDFSKIIP